MARAHFLSGLGAYASYTGDLGVACCLVGAALAAVCALGLWAVPRLAAAVVAHPARATVQGSGGGSGGSGSALSSASATTAGGGDVVVGSGLALDAHDTRTGAPPAPAPPAAPVTAAALAVAGEQMQWWWRVVLVLAAVTGLGAVLMAAGAAAADRAADGAATIAWHAFDEGRVTEVRDGRAGACQCACMNQGVCA